MKLKGFWYDSVLLALIFAVAAGFTALAAVRFNQKMLALYECIAILCISAFAVFRVLTNRRRYNRIIRKTAEKLDYTDYNVLSGLSYPVCVCNDEGHIVWCNDLFISDISEKEITQATSVKTFIGEENEDNSCVAVSDRFYIYRTQSFTKDGAEFTIYSFFENTYFKKTEVRYLETRPYVIIFEIDNIDDSRSGFRDSERTEIRGHIEAMIDSWCEKYNSFIKSIGDDRYIAVTENMNIEAMAADKFSVVEKVRNYEYKNKNAGVTISVGISSGDNLMSAEKNARRAIDMALGRGGDQVALKKDDGYEFFGGVSKSAEKKYRSEIRLWGRKLAEEINESYNVIICGHSFSDFDAIGAAAGIAFIARKLKTPAFIAVDKSKTLAEELIKKLEESGYSDLFINGEEAETLVGKKTLFVLVDTHIPAYSEFPILFETAEKRVIIDHHRLAPGTDETTATFIHNPGASSTCEMITELLQYAVPDAVLSPEISEALLSGIMLDTKNFVIKSGVRTFEAAAYLKEKGADTVSVKRFFATPLDVVKLKNETIMNAKLLDNYAIAVIRENVDNARLVAAQAADELLSVKNTGAAFVIYPGYNGSCISARSLGDVNVQLIMEKLGGGGHQTMAACQINDVDIDAAEELLCEQLRS